MRAQALALVVLAAVTSAAALVHREPPVWLPPVIAPPERLGRWSAEVGAPEDVLPQDPRATLTFRRTYRQNRRIVWLAISYYPFFGTPARRPDVTLIAPPTRPAVRAYANSALLSNGPSRRAPAVNLIAVAHGPSGFQLIYWYRLGSDVLRSEYALRLRLLWGSLIGQPRPLALVRLASPSLDDLRDFLQAEETPVISLLGS